MKSRTLKSIKEQVAEQSSLKKGGEETGMTTNTNTINAEGKLEIHSKIAHAEAFNPLNTQIQTLEVKNKSIDGYFIQIKNNMMIAGKAIYFVCRDLYEAKNTLVEVSTTTTDGTIISHESHNRYNQLLDRLKISEATERKYLAIGRNTNLSVLYKNGQLPTSWTTQYHLTTLTDEELLKASTQLREDSSVAKINKFAGRNAGAPNPVDPNSKPKDVIKTYKFVSIQYDLDNHSKLVNCNHPDESKNVFHSETHLDIAFKKHIAAFSPLLEVIRNETSASSVIEKNSNNKKHKIKLMSPSAAMKKMALDKANAVDVGPLDVFTHDIAVA
jgi:hypothetical protein